MKRIIGLDALRFIIMGCCPFTAAIQGMIEPILNALSELMGIDLVEIQDFHDLATPESAEIAVTEPFISHISPCEGIYERYQHDPAQGEITADYIGSWHASESISARYSERFVLFASGNYLFFPGQYECAYTFKSCVPSPIEDGVWGVQGQEMHFAEGGELNTIISRSVTKIHPSPDDESPYPFKTTIDGLTFWLMPKGTDYWDPETGVYCDW